MAHGRKTGGRQPGTPNKATSSLCEAVEREAGAPLPVILARIARRAMDAGDDALAINALSKAAAYVYPRIATADPSPTPLPDVVVNFADHLPCTACGHDPKNRVHITREILHGPART